MFEGAGVGVGGCFFVCLVLEVDDEGGIMNV